MLFMGIVAKRAKMSKVKSAFATNSFLNMVAAAVPLAALQLLVLPFVNARVGGEEYGLIVTVISLFTLCPAVFGNTLNNIRLISDKEYDDSGVQGDFNVAAVILGVAGIVITTIAGLVYIGEFSVFDLVGLCIVSLLYFIEGYYSVGFLLKLDYKRVLFCNLFKTAGFLVGTLLFWVTGYWYWIYILGYFAASAYILRKTDLAEEPFAKTPLFWKTMRSEGALLVAALLGSFVTYADRLLLFPLIGGTAVAVYYASSLLGKIVSMVIGPVSNVLLAYLSKSSSVKGRTLVQGGIVTLLLGVVVFIVCLAAAHPVLTVLYPNLVDEAMTIVVATTAAGIVRAWSTIVNPLVLRFCNLAWQIFLNVLNIVMYVAFSVLMFNALGLLGFALGVLISSLLMLALRLGILFFKKADYLAAS